MLFAFSGLGNYPESAVFQVRVSFSIHIDEANCLADLTQVGTLPLRRQIINKRVTAGSACLHW
ncbi:MAG: hypothetical protein M3Z32_08955, partial [Acidobacteriota bacterium]|nr:hypothetical protein [Acidobacteriota bacterium]